MPPYQVAGHQDGSGWVEELDEGVDIEPAARASKRKGTKAAVANRSKSQSGSSKKPAKPKKMVSFVASERPAKVHTGSDKRQQRSMKQDVNRQMPKQSKEKQKRERERSEYAYGPPKRSEQRQKEPTFGINRRLGRDEEKEDEADADAEVRGDGLRGERNERNERSSKSKSKQKRRDSPHPEASTKERKQRKRAEEERAERRARREAEALEREAEEREERRQRRRAERKRSISPRRRPSPVRRNSNPLLHPFEFIRRSFSTTHIPIEHRHQPKRRHTDDDGRIPRDCPHEEPAPIRIKVERKEKPRSKTAKQSSTESSPKGEKVEKPVKLYQCLTCLEDLPRRETRKLACSHRMCGDCLKRLFKLSITDPQHMPPKCCTQSIPYAEAEKLVPFTSNFKKKFQQKREEFTTENRIYCPGKKCGTWIRPKDIEKVEGRKQGKCRKCKTKVCGKCNQKWHGGKGNKCPDDVETTALLEKAREEGWKRCYSCKTLVELKEGCNHMTCRCTAEFCMVCGLKWKTCACPWFNYQLVEDDRLNHMRVPEQNGWGQFNQPLQPPPLFHQQRQQRAQNGPAVNAAPEGLQNGGIVDVFAAALGAINDLHEQGDQEQERRAARARARNREFAVMGMMRGSANPAVPPVEQANEQPRQVASNNRLNENRERRARRNVFEDILFPQEVPRHESPVRPPVFEVPVVPDVAVRSRAERSVSSRSRSNGSQAVEEAPKRRPKKQRPDKSVQAGLSNHETGSGRVDQWREFVRPGEPRGISVV